MNNTKSRIEALTDGVFSIVMTLLVFDIAVPQINGEFSEIALWNSLLEQSPIFIAYTLSFVLLTSLWIGHNFLISSLTLSTNRTLVTINMAYLAMVSIIPFSSKLLGSYPDSSIAISWYAINVMLIYVFSYFVRDYIINSKSIESEKLDKLYITKEDLFYGNVRVLLNFGICILAIIVSFYIPKISALLLLSVAILGIIPGSVAKLCRITRLDKFIK